MALEFKEFEKIARLNRDVVVTEKIDGTNAGVHVSLATGRAEDWESVAGVSFVGRDSSPLPWLLRASSRSGFITPGPGDNCGFAAWVRDNASDLVGLGEGSHFGEWWGAGIQRGYGLKDKRFSLFNVGRWRDPRKESEFDSLLGERATAPECCSVVPVLAYLTGFADVHRIVAALRLTGSYASPGYMKPEGVVAYHTAARTMFKVTLERDEEPKTKVKGERT